MVIAPPTRDDLRIPPKMDRTWEPIDRRFIGDCFVIETSICCMRIIMVRGDINMIWHDMLFLDIYTYNIIYGIIYIYIYSGLFGWWCWWFAANLPIDGIQSQVFQAENRVKNPDREFKIRERVELGAVGERVLKTSGLDKMSLGLHEWTKQDTLW